MQIIKCGDAVQAPVLVSALPLELARDEVFVTKGGTQHSESLTVRGRHQLPTQNWLTAAGGEVTDVRWLLASGVPNTRFALVQENSRTVPERCREKVVKFADAFWQGDDLNIVEEGENGFPVAELVLQVVEGFVLGQSIKGGHQRVPCSPPSPCVTWWA